MTQGEALAFGDAWEINKLDLCDLNIRSSFFNPFPFVSLCDVKIPFELY